MTWPIRMSPIGQEQPKKMAMWRATTRSVRGERVHLFVAGPDEEQFVRQQAHQAHKLRFKVAPATITTSIIHEECP